MNHVMANHQPDLFNPNSVIFTLVFVNGDRSVIVPLHNCATC